MNKGIWKINELTQVKKIRDDLQEQVAIKSGMAESLMNSDVKLQKLKQLLATKLFLVNPKGENLQSLMNLEIEDLFSKYDQNCMVKDAFKVAFVN